MTPSAPSRARSRRIVFPLLSGLLLILAACASTARPAAPTPTLTPPPPTAAALLARAAAAPLRDAAFTLVVHPGAGGEGGTGLLTTRPKRLETLVGATFDAQWGRITDGATYYEKLPVSPTWFATTDTHTLLNQDGGGWLFFLDPLDYGQLQGATLRGTETLDGVATWHLSARWPLPAPLAGASEAGVTSAAEDLWLDRATAYPLRVDLHAGSGDQAAGIEDVSVRFTAWDTGQAVALPPAGGPSPLTVDVRPSPWACAEVVGPPCAPAPCAADAFPCFELAGCSAADGADNFPSFVVSNSGNSSLAWSGILTPASDRVALVPAGGLLAPGAAQTARLHGAGLASTGPGGFDTALTAGGHTVLVAVQCHNG